MSQDKDITTTTVNQPVVVPVTIEGLLELHTVSVRNETHGAFHEVLRQWGYGANKEILDLRKTLKECRDRQHDSQGATACRVS